MAIPSTVTLTPNATITIAEGIATDTSSEFWQLVTGSVFVVYENVPYALAQNIIASGDPDTAIASQLAAYPKRIAAV